MPTNVITPEVIEGRLILIHQVIHEAATAITIKQIVARIEEEPSRWPEADWKGARKGPPDYQQVLNYVKRLIENDLIESERGHFILTSKCAPPPRRMRARAQEALDLKAEGLNGVQIAERMGISRSLAYNLINDPHGTQERERKRRYCPACGAKKEPAVEWCRKCKLAKCEDLLPTPDFLGYARRYQERTGCAVIFGVTPDYVRVIRIETQRGVMEHKLGVRDTWDDAVQELGLD